jgi:ferrous iron transport protein B
MFERGWLFLKNAGTIILAISIVLWALTTYPKHPDPAATPTEQIAHSFAGQAGHLIEPVIKPLGFDWKIGIALITSFAAREVFVGTMSTIYSVGDEESASMTVKQKMRGEINPDTGGPRYTLAVGLSLMLFYAFAMQCMSTVATVFRETRRLKYPVFQVVYMSGMAYLASLIAYQLLKP